MDDLNALTDHNIKVPEDIALFGFSNWFMSSVINPGLSSVEQHGYEMGEKSAHLLFHEIDCKHNNIPIEPQIITLPTKLIIRESC